MKRLTQIFACILAPITLPALSQDLPDPIVDMIDDASESVAAWNFVGGGASATLTVNDGTLQIYAPASSNSPGIAAVRKDALYDDFVVEADVLPDPATGRVHEMVGLIARDNNSGNFYAMSIGHTGASIEIWDITGNRGNKLSSKSSLDLDWTKPLRLVFKGIENQLTAQVLDGTTVVGETSVTNSRYKEGTVGLVQFHLFRLGKVQTRFDNFKVFHPANPPKAGTRITVNPVIDGFTWSIDPAPHGGMRVGWSGGGHLQKLNEKTGEMSTVATTNPFQSDAPKGVFRVVDPWDGSRRAEILVPPTYTESSPLPLVIGLHGENTDPDYIESYFNLAELAESHGFLLAQPNGLIKKGTSGWSQDETVDDVGYIRGLIEAVKVNLNVDPDRIFLFGHGNGGTAAYRVAATHGELIAGVVTLEGSASGALSTVFTEPVHVLHIHGDDTSDGPPLEEAAPIIDTWGTVAGHDANFREPQKTLDLQENLGGLDTTVTRKIGGSAFTAVEHWEIAGGVHFDSENHNDFGAEVIDWLLAHPKPAKRSLTLSGKLSRSTAEECKEIATLVEGVELNEGATDRWFFKEQGAHSAFGEITSEYAFDMTFIILPDVEEPVPIKANGRVIMTIVETGNTLYWEQETNFTPNGVFFTATNFRGTGALEGIWGRVQGTAIPDDVGGFSYTSSGWWHDPMNEPLTLSGELSRSTPEECKEIAALVEGVELVEGATDRWYFKEQGNHSALGDITAEYAFDMTLISLPDVEEPIPVRANGRLIMTVSETGDTIYWEQETNFTPEGVFFEATKLRGTGDLNGIRGNVSGSAIPDDVGGFSYTSNGWWRDPR